MKPFTVAITRAILDQHFKGEVSYTKMVELLNEQATKYYNGGCLHQNIIYLQINPTDGWKCQPSYRLVKCSDCGEQLPIHSIYFEEKNVPLIKIK